jgi:D-alanyl-D-alanine dipeptidase
MPALVAGIHVFLLFDASKDVDGRDKPGHDEESVSIISRTD